MANESVVHSGSFVEDHFRVVAGTESKPIAPFMMCAISQVHSGRCGTAHPIFGSCFVRIEASECDSALSASSRFHLSVLAGFVRRFSARAHSCHRMRGVVAVSQPNLSTEELADRWSVTTRTIKRWRSEGIGPRSFKVGQIVRYRLDDVEHFECRPPSTTPQTAGAAA